MLAGGGFYSSATHGTATPLQHAKCFSHFGPSPPPAFAAPHFHWDPLAFPAFLVNGPSSYRRRKWAEQQLASIGYTSYTRVNSGNSSLIKANCYKCRVGVTLGHLRAWRKFLRTGSPHAFFFEDDVVLHADFAAVWPNYMARVPANFSFLYVGQLSRRFLSEPAPFFVQSEVMPWGAHAYIMHRSTAVFLVDFFGYVTARARQPVAPRPHWVGEEELDLIPAMHLAYFDVKNDFLLNTVFEHFYKGGSLEEGGGGGQPSWFTFESTAESPAVFHGYSWGFSDEIMIAGQPTGATSATHAALKLWDAGVFCGAFMKNASMRARFPGQLAIMGTGLAFQNECEDDPFLLHTMAGRAELAVAPSCEQLRTVIRPSELSDVSDGEGDCSDV